ncbi:MAG: cupin domain-containing protein [Anaerolineae bacterium]
MIYNKLELTQLAAGLAHPFYLQQIARLDHFAIYLYLAQGAVARHRHQTHDELFFVVSGTLRIESEWGKVVLREGELAVIPRGVEHASSSLLNTIVMLAQAQADPERKNGHGRITVGENQALSKWSPRDQVHGTGQPFFSLSLAQVDEMAVRAAWCQGVVGWHRHSDHDELLLVIDGQIEIGTEQGSFTLLPNEMVIVPRNRVHHLSSYKQTLLLSLIHSEVSAAAQMGH